MTQRDSRAVLTVALGERKELVDAAVAIFELAQFLLDDDQRLTKTGALDGVGRQQLQARACELLGGPPATDPDDDPALQTAGADGVADDGDDAGNDGDNDEDGEDDEDGGGEDDER